MVAPVAPIFTWQDGKLRSPQEVAREREIAEALMFAKPQGTGFFGALGQIGSALSGGLIDSRADAYEEQGREAASGLFSGLGAGASADAISQALLDPAAAWATPAQSSVAEALFNNELRQSDPAYQLDLAYKQAQLDALNAPAPYDPWANTKIVNDQIIGWGENGPQVMGDFRSPDSPLVTVNNGETSNIGTIPPGFAAIVDPSSPAGYRFERIPGGDPAMEAAQIAEAEAKADERQDRTANVVVQDIDRALEQIESNPALTTGLGAQLTSGWGGSPAGNVAELLNSVKANAGFQELQAMRESSPTGGALGQVTERELSFLQSTIGSLVQSQSDQQLKDNLRRVKNAYLDIIHGPGNGPTREPLSFDKPPQFTQEQYNAAPSGTRFTAPDGTVRVKQ